MGWQWNSLNQYKYNSHPQRGGLHTPEAAGEALDHYNPPKIFYEAWFKRRRRSKKKRKPELEGRYGKPGQMAHFNDP